MTENKYPYLGGEVEKALIPLCDRYGDEKVLKCFRDWFQRQADQLEEKNPKMDAHSIMLIRSLLESAAHSIGDAWCDYEISFK